MDNTVIKRRGAFLLTLWDGIDEFYNILTKKW